MMRPCGPAGAAERWLHCQSIPRAASERRRRGTLQGAMAILRRGVPRLDAAIGVLLPRALEWEPERPCALRAR